MSKKNDGGPAFPKIVEGIGGTVQSIGGMSLRDYFASQALAGTMASGSEAVQSKEQAAFIATESYLMADAMLAARDKQ